jgi:hypothetical protein
LSVWVDLVGLSAWVGLVDLSVCVDLVGLFGLSGWFVSLFHLSVGVVWLVCLSVWLVCLFISFVCLG